jgi:type I restriction enzyme S subunit
LDARVASKPSGVEWLGDVPEHWEVRRLGVLFREVNEQGKNDLPILSVSIHDGVSDKEMAEEELDRKVTRSDDRTKYKRVAAGDLVYNMMRAWQGGFGTVAVEGMVSPAYVVARPRSELVTSYVEHVLRTPAAVEQMRRHSRGITDFRLRLYWDEFKNISVPVPPPREVRDICAAIDGLAKQAEALEAEAHSAITLLQERRSALISAAVTGQIDARGLADLEAA